MANEFQESMGDSDELSDSEGDWVSTVPDTEERVEDLLPCIRLLWNDEVRGGESPSQVQANFLGNHNCFPYNIDMNISGKEQDVHVVMANMEKETGGMEGLFGVRLQEEGQGENVLVTIEGQREAEYGLVGSVVGSEDERGKEGMGKDELVGSLAHNEGRMKEGREGRGRSPMDERIGDEFGEALVKETEDDVEIEEFLESMGLMAVRVKDRDEWRVKNVRARKSQTEREMRKLEWSVKEKGRKRKGA